MMAIIEFLSDYKWAFSGVGVVLVAGIFNVFRKKDKPISQVASQNNTQNVSITVPPSVAVSADATQEDNSGNSLDKLRANARILFIDDDKNFKVVDVLLNSGWVNTKSVRDIKDLNSLDIKDTDIFFVDIHGVGLKLCFKDEGLGLAAAIKNKYPDKKVVIYSAESKGERFHEAFKLADDSLRKDADPYEFEQIIENLASDILLNRNGKN